MICCPIGDISVELAGDTGIRVPPAEYHSATVLDFFGVAGAKPSKCSISHRELLGSSYYITTYGDSNHSLGSHMQTAPCDGEESAISCLQYHRQSLAADRET